MWFLEIEDGDLRGVLRGGVTALFRVPFHSQALPEALVGCVVKLIPCAGCKKNLKKKLFFFVEKLYFEIFCMTFFDFFGGENHRKLGFWLLRHQTE